MHCWNTRTHTTDSSSTCYQYYTWVHGGQTVPRWTQQHVIVVENRLNFTRKAWNRKEADNSCSIINCCCILRELQKLQRKAKYWIQNIKRSLMLRAPNTQLQTQVEGIKKGWPTPKKLSIPVFIKVQCTRTNLLKPQGWILKSPISNI